MLKYILYPLFGLGVLGAYVVSASSATDVGTIPTAQQQLPPMAGPSAAGSSGVGSSGVGPSGAGPSGAGYAALPIIWYTGFHGPSRYVPSSSSSGGGYVGGYGGFSGGK